VPGDNKKTKPAYIITLPSPMIGGGGSDNSNDDKMMRTILP
jgi:hypothetical protein